MNFNVLSNSQFEIDFHGWFLFSSKKKIAFLNEVKFTVLNYLISNYTYFYLQAEDITGKDSFIKLEQITDNFINYYTAGNLSAGHWCLQASKKEIETIRINTKAHTVSGNNFISITSSADDNAWTIEAKDTNLCEILIERQKSYSKLQLLIFSATFPLTQPYNIF